MLSGIIGPSDTSPSPPPPSQQQQQQQHVAVNTTAATSETKMAKQKRDDDDDDDSSPERLKTKALQSLKRNKGEKLADTANVVSEPSAPGT